MVAGYNDIENNNAKNKNNILEPENNENEWGFFIVLDTDESKPQTCTTTNYKNMKYKNLYNEDLYYEDLYNDTPYYDCKKLYNNYEFNYENENNLYSTFKSSLPKRHENNKYYENYGNIALVISAMVFIANLFIVNNMKK